MQSEDLKLKTEAGLKRERAHDERHRKMGKYIIILNVS